MERYLSQATDLVDLESLVIFTVNAVDVEVFVASV